MIKLYLSLVLVMIAIVLFILAARQRRQTGLPSGKVIYIDTSKWGKVEKPLYDPKLRLTGKPDYLVRQGEHIVPVEVKSRRAPASPHDSHIYQIAAYCLLVNHAYGVRPTHGIIHYSDKTFAIDFSGELEQAVKKMIVEMQERSSHTEVKRSHQDAKRCKHCGYRSVCDQALRI
ncbi:MAG: CRISPR-associated protein Cas4 [Anaerolineales bacterium]|nr:CRISPR-associated protein Cas4 [Anaerolineae bacterium]PWB54960.1 MAG: CRISPR-associated protein Cas4 [Anaerolineales bacterium]